MRPGRIWVLDVTVLDDARNYIGKLIRVPAPWIECCDNARKVNEYILSSLYGNLKRLKRDIKMAIARVLLGYM